ncbi:GNAT family N-acetyltransferase [Pseudodesulfovibrio cashew]|uniref:GNAT family N-acetyltransferase n=1 Tax=Pseudodesulfovibrio cashew TaxID=2678688 RepID=A0A6I6JDP2_9BACT|nr:GNAT family N-acetyltransferase [Pseudodesulfovibrio cashew]QGY38753.1 GNAT family N-acetyltransferase [Pseudodesulfovibrio cashew]
MNNDIIYGPLPPEREAEAVALVRSVFDTAVAPGYGEQGRATFHDYVTQLAFSQRSQGAFALTAEQGGKVIGVIEVLDTGHVALLFVSPDRQGLGVGGELMRRAVAHCRRSSGAPTQFTVNASPNAVPAYERMGFAATNTEQELNGVRFVPMTMPLSPPATS